MFSVGFIENGPEIFVDLTNRAVVQVSLSRRPADRMPFQQLSQLMRCILIEVAKGAYIDNASRQQVHTPLLATLQP